MRGIARNVKACIVVTYMHTAVTPTHCKRTINRSRPSLQVIARFWAKLSSFLVAATLIPYMQYVRLYVKIETAPCIQVSFNRVTGCWWFTFLAQFKHSYNVRTQTSRLKLSPKKVMSRSASVEARLVSWILSLKLNHLNIAHTAFSRVWSHVLGAQPKKVY